MADQQQHWETLRRALLMIVAQTKERDPAGRYTLDIRIVPREQATRPPR